MASIDARRPIDASIETMSSRDPRAPLINPYYFPAIDIQISSLASPGDSSPVDRGTRLAARVIDSLIVLLTLAPAQVAGWPQMLAMIRSGEHLSPFWWLGTGWLEIVTLIAWLGLMAAQAYLITRTGQSIGKRFCRIRIVRWNDDGTAGFVRGVLLRMWLLEPLAFIPFVGRFLFLVDVIFIFRDDRRCLHDLVAGTKVVRG
jgi:uncharacterized RDD family membrane protein YckC